MTVTDRPAVDLLDGLRGRGMAADFRWPWVHVGHTERRSGWKLHVTGLPTTLDQVVEWLVAQCTPASTPFKVAASPDVVALLDEGGLGESQVGKVATVYPHDDQDLARLVRDLRDQAGLVGPHVRDDVWLGGPAYVRYGTFAGHVRRDVLGQLVTSVDDLDGRLVPDAYDPDLTLERFHRCFDGRELGRWRQEKPRPPQGVVGGRYLVVDALRTTAVGGLYQAFDVTAAAVRPMMLKLGLAHTMSDRHGRDIRSRLLHQEEMHALVSPYGVAPACDPYFEIEAGGVLPVAYQENDNLEAFVLGHLRHRTIDHAPPTTTREILEVLEQVGRHLETLHGLGVVHRDISPANVLLGRGGTAQLSDLELAVVVGASEPVHGKGTPGFMAPEQYSDAAPSPAMDVHAFSALAVFALVGLDPRRLPRPEQSDRWRAMSRLARTVPADTWAVLRSGMALAPGDRPGLEEVRRALRLVDGIRPRRVGSSAQPASSEPRPPHTDEGRDGLLSSALATLVSPALVDPAGRWLSAPLRQGRGAAFPELRRSLNRGAAGPLYLCAGLADGTEIPDDVAAVCLANARHLVADTTPVDAGMPGLHFGETGVLLALQLARDRGLSTHADADVEHLWRAVLDSDITWLDVTHGAAGMSMGLAQLAPLMSSTPHEARIRDRVAQLVALLLRTQAEDGSWVTPGGVPGMSGETITGFAHGVAGIAHALALAAARDRDERCLDAAVRAADWLTSCAVPGPSGALSWPYGDQHPEPWSWWCHGAPGISRLFALLHAVTGDPRHRDTATACFRQVPEGFNPPNLSLCHGLAGLAELMLDVSDLLDDDDLRRRALAMVDTIAARRFEGTVDTYWVVEDTDVVSADLMVGLAGVVHLLARAASGAPLVSWDATGPLH